MDRLLTELLLPECFENSEHDYNAWDTNDSGDNQTILNDDFGVPSETETISKNADKTESAGEQCRDE